MTELALRPPAFARPTSLDTPATSSVRIALVGTALVMIAGIAGLLHAAMLAPFVMLLLWFPTTPRPLRLELRGLLDRERRARARTERHRRRQLRPTGPLIRGKYDELRERVDRLTRASRPLAEKLELEGLLEHYVRVALSYHQYLSAMPLWSDSEPRWLCDGLPAGRALSTQIAARRAEHRNACWRRVDDLVNELDAIDEFVALVEQRLACPEADTPLDGELGWRLSCLDDLETALRELTAPADRRAADEARRSSRAAPG